MKSSSSLERIEIPLHKSKQINSQSADESASETQSEVRESDSCNNSEIVIDLSSQRESDIEVHREDLN